MIPTNYERMTHKGRCIEEAKTPGYCGSCDIQVHCAQMRDELSWVHSSKDSWERAYWQFIGAQKPNELATELPVVSSNNTSPYLTLPTFTGKLVWNGATFSHVQMAVFASVSKEREFGDKKHGAIDKDGGHTLGEWILLIESELAEAKLALVKGGVNRNSVRSELTQVAALAVAALEQHGLVEPHEGRQV